MENIKDIFWPDGDIDDYFETACKRLLIFFALFAFIISIVVTARYLALRPGTLPSHAETTLYSYFVYLLVPIALYKGMSIKLVAYLTITYTFFRLATVAFVMGGLASSQVLFFLPTVLLLTFLCGNKAGFIAMLIAIGFFTFLLIGTQHTVNLRHMPILVQRYTGIVCALVMVYAIGAISSRQMSITMKGYIEAKSRAQDASRAKSDFLSNMSHEIRTPLNGVIGISQALRLTELSDKQQKMLNIMERSGDALLNIIGDILDFSKIEAGKVELESAPFDPRQIVQDVAEALVGLTQEKNLKLFVDAGQNLPNIVYGDSNRYRQVLFNFVSNAIKFTHQGQITIKLTGTVTDQVLQLETRVTDTGIGIAPEMTSAIFEHFTQANTGTTRIYGGTGLGLSICGGLVDLMGGEIGVDSVEGEGASFWCLTPFPLTVSSDVSLTTEQLSA